jgi:hypothetical protein
MSKQVFFNSAGQFVAFRRTARDKYLFDKNGKWIGWFPWNDGYAVDTKGTYLGTIAGNRFLKENNPRYRGYPGYPGYPGYAGYPGYPGFAGYAGYNSRYKDVEPIRLIG